jgi:hypothetical protein
VAISLGSLELPGAFTDHVEAIAVQFGTVYSFGYCDDPHGPCVFTSSDGGDSWKTSGVKDVEIDRLIIDPSQEHRMYVAGPRNVYRPNSSGATWEACGRGWDMLARDGARMAIDPQGSDRLFLATRGEGVWISEDGCLSWQKKYDGLGNLFVNAVVIDPVNPDTIYAGTDGGAYVSFNGGDTWGEINDGLMGVGYGPLLVYSIVVDPKDPNNVYAATPYGIFKLESR